MLNAFMLFPSLFVINNFTIMLIASSKDIKNLVLFANIQNINYLVNV